MLAISFVVVEEMAWYGDIKQAGGNSVVTLRKRYLEVH